MRRNNKKALYEKIMQNVAREVKRALNENMNKDEYILYFVTDIDEDGVPTLEITETFSTPEEGVEYFFNLEDVFNDNVLYDTVNNYYYCHEDEFENYDTGDISFFTDDNGNERGKVEIDSINIYEDWLDPYDSHTIYVLN